MQERILQVFYGNDRLPYKDKDRTVHYPITGNTFLGSSNVDKIRFYVRDIGGTNNITWVLNAKLPNGSILYQVLSTIGLDSGLGEYYVEFSVSQFYTQLIGDTYFALNGCDGNVEIETDDETNIQTITATIESQTILTTGVIKFSNNYAPQRPLGFSFDLDQYQTIIDALSSKSNVANTIQVVADIGNEDTSGYEDGQLFYDILTKRFYKKTDDSITYYNFVANNQASVSVIINPTTNINGRVFVHFTSSLETIGGYPVYKIKYDGQNTTEEQAREYMLYMTGSAYLPKYNYDRPANTYFLTPDGQLLKPQYDDTNGLLLIIMPKLALESYVVDNYVPYTGASKDVNLGTHTIVANNLYKGSKTNDNELTTKGEISTNYVPYTGANKDIDLGNNKLSIGDDINLYGNTKAIHFEFNNNFGEIYLYNQDLYFRTLGGIFQIPAGTNGVAVTKSYVDNIQTTLQTNIDASGHSLAISGGANTDYVYTITLKDKNNNSLSEVSFDLPLESVVVSGSYDSATQSIVLTLQDGSTITIPVGDLIDGLVSQSDFNDLSATVTTNNNNAMKYANIIITSGYVAQLEKNGVAYPVAQNVTTYTTPKVVETTSDLPQENDGYLYLVVADGYLYYWNNGAWVQGYEYATDLNQYVQTSRTIAGINLANDIGAQALTDALVFMNNTTDLDYVMED